LAKAFDEAAGNVYNAFIEGGIEDPKKGGAWVPWQWGQGSAVGFSSGQGLKSFYLED